jgi:nucleolar protein 53
MPLLSGPVHKMTNEDLFTVDLTGDDKSIFYTLQMHHLIPFTVRQRVKTKKPLTASLILAQRSAVPAVYSRAVHERKKDSVTKAETERLLRIGKRKRTGPSNSAIDPTETGKGSALLETSEAVKQSGTYDVWMDVDEDPSSVAEFDAIVQTKPVKVR